LDSIDEVSADIPQGYTCNKKMKILTGMSYAEQVYFDPSANTKELSWKCDEQLVFTYEEHAFNVSSRWLFICFKFIVLEYDQSTW
jgi:hypothetical protein